MLDLRLYEKNVGKNWIIWEKKKEILKENSSGTVGTLEYILFDM